jgi:DNA-binding NarL/FixJ family response regulator
MKSVEPDRRLEDVIGLVYEAALDPRLWHGLANKAARAFESTSTVFKTYGADERVQLVDTTPNLLIAPKDRGWADHWHQNDLWVQRSLAVGMSRVITDRDLLATAEYEKSGFYQDWNRHLEIYHLVGAVFPVDQQTVGVLGIHRQKKAGAYTMADRERVARFLPHLKRALQIRGRLQHVSLAGHAAADALDKLDTAVVIVDEQCLLLHTNHVADRLLRTEPVIDVHSGRLTFNDARLDAELVRRVKAAALTATGMSQTPLPALLIDRAGRLPMTLLVTPLRSAADINPAMPRAAMVFIKDPEKGIPMQTTLCELFGFTRTEAAVAASLATGLDLGSIARTFQISVGTTRAHVKAILSKSGTHRQAQFVALIARSVASINAAS